MLFDVPLKKQDNCGWGSFSFIFLGNFHFHFPVPCLFKGSVFFFQFPNIVLQIMNLDLGPRPLTGVLHSFFLVVLVKASRM